MPPIPLPNIDLNDYDYDLADEKIAKFPPSKRGQSKLLVYKNGEIINAKFENIFNYLPQKSHLVFNNTKVINARLFFKNSTGAKIEVLLLQPFQEEYQIAFSQTNSVSWVAMVGNKKKWKAGEILHHTILINDVPTVINLSFADRDNNIVVFEWNNPKKSIPFSQIIEAFGQIPLPPYLNRETTLQDLIDYQTVYSTELGAVAAPTAGLHFTDELIATFPEKEITSQFITLHVGAGTFLPIKEGNVIDHSMHNEQILFDLLEIQQLQINIGHIIPVGTTSLRAIESLYWFGVKLEQIDNQATSTEFFIEKLYPYNCELTITAEKSLANIIEFMIKNKLTSIIGKTEIFIFPTYQFRLCKGIITNFHQPKSTLLLLISALIGDKWKKIYAFALENNYNFLSYGDSSLLLD